MVVVQTLVSILICVVPMLVTPKPATHHVNIENMQFQPDVVSVARGDSIVWTNKDLFPHTVTSKSGEFDSHEIKPGETWTYRAAKAGEADYVCSLHPTMHAVLRVK
jgi:plastocyanin